MPRLKYSLLAVAGIVLLAMVLSVIGPKRALAALGYTPILDVENPGLHPLQHVLSNGGSFTVPAKQRLVIDSIDGYLTSKSNPVIGVQLLTYTNGETHYISHFFPVTFMGDAYGYNSYATAQRVQIYADPGTNVQFFMSTPDLHPDGAINISGHLVDIP